jgi:hypothetical protein
VARFAVLLLALGGCNIVLQIDHIDPPPPAVCGPYGPAVPVAFSSDLAMAHDLAVVGTLGTVVTEEGGISHVTPVMGNDTLDEWKPDGRAKIDRYTGHAVASGTVFAVGVDDSTYVLEFEYVPNVWSSLNPTLPKDACFNMRAGNEIDVVDPVNGPQLRRVAVVKRPSGEAGCTIGKPQLVLVTRVPPFDLAHLWTEDPARTLPLNQSEIVPSQAVLTQDLRTLVYAGGDGETTSDLYVTTLDPDTNMFGVGQKITSLSTPDPEDEPWIDADCSTIWFRRNGVTMMARKQ